MSGLQDDGGRGWERLKGEGFSITFDTAQDGAARTPVAGDWAGRPVNYVSYWDSCRFANWLNNGQPTGPQGAGTTETGAYTLNGATFGAAQTISGFNITPANGNARSMRSESRRSCSTHRPPSRSRT